MAKIDIEKFREHESNKLVRSQVHPEQDLIIWNYTERVQYDKLWDEITLMTRGLITNSQGEIIARPFGKFFNLGEYAGDIPNEPFKVTDKVDGSLIIVTNYINNLLVATRGSFTSTQSIKALKILSSRYHFLEFPANNTYLFELVCESNRIVVNYGDIEDLVLLAIINTDTGEELFLEDLGFPVVKEYKINSLEEIINEETFLSKRTYF